MFGIGGIGKSMKTTVVHQLRLIPRWGRSGGVLRLMMCGEERDTEIGERDDYDCC